MDDNAKSADEKSYFDGGLLQLIGWTILGILVTVFTLGICFPWALCWRLRWEMNHTVIEGKRLQFNGTGLGLLGKWIIWMLLCIITLGIFSLWLGIAIKKWQVKNTTFVN